jgi:NDP-sugar pyrophosphorylase family protein
MISSTAVILCGGFGTRLRPVVSDRPKILAPVADKPFLRHLLNYLRAHGVFDIVLCAGHMSDQIMDYLSSGEEFDSRIRLSIESEPLGTGGAIKQAEHLLPSGPFFVLNGDSLAQGDLSSLLRFHLEKNASITLALVEVQDKSRFGSVALGADGAILRFEEKGETGAGLINAGIYVMNRAVLDTIPCVKRWSLEMDVFPEFVGKGLYGMTVSGPFVDIGLPESYALAQSLLNQTTQHS